MALDLADILLHSEKYIENLFINHNVMAFIILFGLIFCETGLVVMTFLPGDSLIFIVGAFASKGLIGVSWFFLVSFFAALAGDSVNYWLGNYLGAKAFVNNRLFKNYLSKAKKFYGRYGVKAIVFARFIPVMRSLAPFVAGIGRMEYSKFLFFNAAGTLIWVSLFLFGGYFFGAMPFVRENLGGILLVLLVLSFIPSLIEYILKKRAVK